MDEFEDGDSERNVEALETFFYEGEDCRVSNPQKALSLFSQVLSSQVNAPLYNELRFKAIVQIISIKVKLGQVEKLSDHLRDLFLYFDSITRGVAVEGMYSIIDSLSVLGSGDSTMLSGLLNQILLNLWSRGQPAHQLWIVVSLKQCRLLMDREPLNNELIESLLARMKGICRLPNGLDDVANKGAQLLDIYATELKYLSSMENRESRVRMKEIISRCSQASSVVSNPRSVAVIKEHAGKVLMTSRRYEEAYNEFFDAFKAYSDTGNLAAKRALNYAVIANMCALSSINPFDSREAKAYEQDSSVAFVKKLRDAYERHRLDEICSLDFSPLLDQVMIGHVSDMIYRLKLTKLATVCPAYKRITIAALGEKVCSDSETTRKMVMRLILEGSIKGLLNEQEVEMSQSEDVGLQEARVLCETAEFIKIKLNGILESHKEA